MTDDQVAQELTTASSPYSVKTMEALAEVMSSGMDKMSERNFIQKAIKIGFSKEDAENIYQKYERIPSWRDTDDWRSGDWYSLIFNVAWKSRSLPIKKRKTTYNDIYEQDKHASDILSMDVVSKTRRLTMDKVKIAGELVRMAEELTAAQGELKYNSPLDQWLVDNGWQETHGIGLYTNSKYPLVGVDTNSGSATTLAFKSKSDVFNTEGGFVGHTDSLSELKKDVTGAAMTAELFAILSKKYPRYKGLLPTSGISFWGDKKKGEVSFEVYTDNWTVVVGGFSDGIKKKMSPNARSIVKFIEKAQQEILTQRAV